MMMKCAVASLALILPSAAALGGPLNTGWIGADAKWILHVDVEGALNSTIGKFILDSGELDDLDELSEMGIDPRKDIFSVTVYGSSDNEKDVVAVLHTSDAVSGVLEMVQAEENYAKATLGGHTVHTWDEGGDLTYAYVQTGPAADERIAVIAQDKQTILDAIGVVKGGGNNLANAEWLSMAAKPRRGAFLYAAATDLGAIADFEPAAQITRHAQQIAFSLGESRDGIFAEVNIKATDEEQAQNLKQVVDGLVAFLNFAPPDDKDVQKVKKLLEGLKIEVDNTNVTIELEIQADLLIELMQEEMGDGARLDVEDDGHGVEILVSVETKEAA